MAGHPALPAHPAATTCPAAKSGFTLSELFVVVTIIAVLASILLPVLGTVRDASRRVSCAANLRQIGTGLQAYLGDNRNRLPPARIDPPETLAYNSTVTLYWTSPQIIGQYTENYGTRLGTLAKGFVVHCPGDRRARYGAGWLASYGLNLNFTTTVNEPEDWAGCHNVLQIPRLAESVFVVDADDARFSPGTLAYGSEQGTGDFHLPGGVPGSAYNWIRRHGTGCNALFGDSHVAFVGDMHRDVMAGTILVK